MKEFEIKSENDLLKTVMICFMLLWKKKLKKLTNSFDLWAASGAYVFLRELRKKEVHNFSVTALSTKEEGREN